MCFFFVFLYVLAIVFAKNYKSNFLTLKKLNIKDMLS